MSRRASASRLGAARLGWLTLALGVAAAGAQEERPPQPADALLARAQTAGWDGIVGLEAVGTLAAGGREMTFHLWRSRDDRLRLELGHRGEQQVFVVDREQGWIQVGSAEPTPLAANQVWERLSWADVFGRFPEFYRRYPRRDLEPATTLLGKPVRPVRLWPRSGYPYLYYVDETNGRIVGGVRQFYDGEEDAVREARLYYDDFRELSPGAALAFVVESDEGTYSQTLQLREVKLLREAPAAELFTVSVDGS
jgi:hypothetical protein